MIDNSMYRLQPSVTSVRQIAGNIPSTSSNQTKNNTTPFNQILTKEITGVNFSKHALERLQSRKITLDQAELSQLSDAVEKAAQKGAKESLILMNNNNLAFVVSVKNKTVITAMDGTSIKDNIFTNIDSAVMI